MTQLRNKDLGIAGKNGGQFGALAPRLESRISLSKPLGQNEFAISVEEGIFDPQDISSGWGRDAARAGAQRRFNVPEDKYTEVLALANDSQGGWQKAREELGLSDDQLRELTATERDLRDSHTPHFINGAGSRRDWAVMTASGLGRVPLVKTSEDSTYLMPPPVGRNGTIKVTEQGTLEFTDSEGFTQETDGAAIHRILHTRKGQALTAAPAPIAVKVTTVTTPPRAARVYQQPSKRSLWDRLRGR